MTPHPDSPCVLVVDDEENIRFLVSSALRLAGMDVATAGTGREAVTSVAEKCPDAVVLDVMLPDMDGFDVLQGIRSAGCMAPVLFLSARHDTQAKVRGLTEGGDDYIAKPFELEELVARVQVALRRVGATPQMDSWTVGDITMDDVAHRVLKAGTEVHLTATEYRLLRCLIRNRGRVVTRAQILDAVWQYGFDGESEIIDSFMSNLRRKVDDGPTRYITTVRGVGYRLDAP